MATSERILLQIARRLNDIFGDKDYQNFLSKLQPEADGWIPIPVVCRKFMSDLFPGNMDDSAMCATVARALERQQLTFVELDLRKRQLWSIRRAPFNLRVLRAVEFWFSDANFSRDLYLQSLLDEETQLIPLRTLLDFKSLRQLLDAQVGQRTTAEDRIKTAVDALTSSEEIDIVSSSKLGVGVRRRPLARFGCETRSSTLAMKLL